MTDDGANVYHFPSGQSRLLQKGGGGGNSGSMEARVAKLESDVGHLLADMKDVRDTLKDNGKTLVDVRERLTKVETKVDHLPSKGFVVSVITLGLGLLTAILIFQDRIQHMLGTSTH